MTEIRIICVGKVKEPHYRKGIDHFLKMIRRKCTVSILECPDQPTPDQGSQAVEKQILQVEGERILSRIRREDYVVALCIDGKQYSSEEWTLLIRKWTDRAASSGGALVFVIGGSLGLSDAVVRRAAVKLSFSALTFPHQMMRMSLCEQLARALEQSGTMM